MLIRKSLPQNLVALRYFSFSGERGERDREGNEEEVVNGGDAELPARQGLRRQSQVHVAAPYLTGLWNKCLRSDRL